MKKVKEMKASKNKVPKHIGIILDGNRRFAKKLMLKPWKGHEWGAKKGEKLLEWCRELGVRELTLYVFSLENFNRPKQEFDYLMDLFRREFDKYKDSKKIHENKVKINVIGRTGLFPKDIQKKIKEIMEKTKDYNNYIVNFALGYGGRAEVIDAVKKLVEQKVSVDKINEEVFKNYLYMESEPELIIRTGGEKRTSNFLIWQSSYSEWIFLDKMWPDFEKEDLVAAIDDFKNRERRFGR